MLRDERDYEKTARTFRDGIANLSIAIAAFLKFRHFAYPPFR